MDRRLQESDYCASHDPGGFTRRHTRLSLNAPQRVGNKQLHRWYVVLSTTRVDRTSPNVMINEFVAQTQGRNIRHYAYYLSERARAYRDTKTDWVRAPESRLEKLSVEKGLLRETEVVQHQLEALLKCDVRGHKNNGSVAHPLRCLNASRH